VTTHKQEDLKTTRWECGVCGRSETELDESIEFVCQECGKPLCSKHVCVSRQRLVRRILRHGGSGLETRGSLCPQCASGHRMGRRAGRGRW
jgi:hypothetical protein